MKRLSWFFLIFPFATVPCEAGVIVQKQGRAQISLPSEETLALSATIHVVLRIEGGPALQLVTAGDLPAGSMWSLVERRPVEREKIGPDREIRSVHFYFAPREPGGKVAFTFPPLKFRDGKEEHSATFTPVYYQVTTLIRNADLAELEDITSIEPLPPRAPVDRSWVVGTLLAGTGLLIFGLAVAAWFWPRRRSSRPPAQLALQEWRRLVAMRLPEQGKSERFVTLLTLLVRRYVEKQYALPARRRTTPEFLHQVAYAAPLAPNEKQFLSAFLDRCEASKFANVAMSPAECSDLAQAVRQFLERRAPVA